MSLKPKILFLQTKASLLRFPRILFYLDGQPSSRMKEFLKGIQNYFKGHQLMVSEKWIKWLLLPGFIALITFPITLLIAFSFLTPEAWLPIWMHGFFGTSLQYIASILISILSYWALQPLIMILLSLYLDI